MKRNPYKDMATGIKFLSSLQTATLDRDILDNNGKVIAEKGSVIVILPQTVAGAVVIENGKTLAELWPDVSKKGHQHEDYEKLLADYQAELIRLADRLTKAELKFAQS